MKTINETLLDRTVAHAVGLQRLANGVVREMISRLNDSDAQIYDVILRNGSQIDRTLSAINNINTRTYRDIGTALERELRDLAIYEADFNKDLIENNLPFDWTLSKPKQKFLKAIVDEEPLVGGLMSEWIEGLANGRYVRTRTAIRMGYSAGEGPDQIVKRIRGTRMANYRDGVAAVSRRATTAALTTLVNHVANRARVTLYGVNDDLVGFVQWTAILDDVTCFTESTRVRQLGDLQGLMRSKYTGDIFIITTASGNQFEGTANHPVLTPDGFLPLHKIDPRKHVLYSINTGVADKKNVNMPPRFAEVYDTLRKCSTFDMHSKGRASAIDFYGDGQFMNGEVNILSINRHLRRDFIPSFDQLLENYLLHLGQGTDTLPGDSHLGQLFDSGGTVLLPTRNSSFTQRSSYPQNASCLGQAWNDLLSRGSGLVKFNCQRPVSMETIIAFSALQRWHDTARFEKSRYGGDAYPILSAEFSGAGPVTIREDQIVSVVREFRSCHVYTLETGTGLYTAGSSIVKNCPQCAALDGLVYDTRLSDLAPLLHLNCRCILVPVVDEWEELGLSQDEIKPGQAKLVDGKPAGKLRYSKWLADQDRETQDDILGKDRAGLFRRGMPLRKFVDFSGKEYSLATLRKIEGKTLARKTGLKPPKFVVKNVLRNYGWKPDLPDLRDHLFAIEHPEDVERPVRMSLRDKMPPIWNQGSLGSCTAFALTAAAMYAFGPETPRLSALDLYYKERLLEGTTDEDSGAAIRDGIKALARWGVATEETWPYKIRSYKKTPSEAAAAEDQNYKIKSYSRLRSHDDFMKALTLGYPFVGGFSVYENFDDATITKKGILEVPEVTQQLVGGHAVLFTGYDTKFHDNPVFKESGLQTSQVPAFMYEVRNSFGSDWGDGGYFWIPGEYVEDRNLADDFWVIKR